MSERWCDFNGMRGPVPTDFGWFEWQLLVPFRWRYDAFVSLLERRTTRKAMAHAYAEAVIVEMRRLEQAAA